MTPAALTLTAFLTEVAKRRRRWGICDCLMVPADWTWLRTGRDPAAGFRGVYRSAAEAAALLRREGGKLGLAARGMAAAGLERTDDPRPGDVAMVEWRGVRFGAIRGPSGMWAIKANDGLSMSAKVRVLAAWAVG